MKKLFTILAVAAAVVACQKNETIALDNGEAISFGNAFVENSTRATDPSYGENAQPLTAFNVWGTVDASNGNPVAIFANDPVSGTVGVNSTWNCTSKTQYWINGAKYNFAALVNAGTVGLGTDLLPATVAFESNGSKDLLYAKSAEYTGKPTGQNVKVAFTFQHLLSKVCIKVTNNSTAAAGYSFLVKNIRINAPKTAGSYDIATSKWTAATDGDYTFNNITVASGAANAECDAEQLLIPGAATIYFTVDILVGDSTISTKDYNFSTTLAAGNSYNFNIQASVGDPILFTVEKNPEWVVNDSVNIN